MTRSLRPLFVAGALAIAALVSFLLFGGYLYGAKHHRWPIVRRLLRVDVVRRYLVDDASLRVLRVTLDQNNSEGAFSSVWDTNAGVRLSRRLFDSTEMYGAQKYRYRPNLRKLMFRLDPDVLDLPIETEDTPAVRAALDEAHTSFVSASYDALGFRRVDADLTSHCDARVLFLGDSFTDGMWVGDEKTFVNIYGRLARERSHQRICPVNAGVNGYGTMEETWVLEHSFEAVGRPGLVVLMYFANDVDADFESVIDGTIAEGERKWRESFSYLRKSIAYSRAHGARFVLVAIPASVQLSQPSTRVHYQDVLKGLSETEGVMFIDLLDRFQTVDARDLYWDWDPHLTPHGHEVVADILYQETRTLWSAAR